MKAGLMPQFFKIQLDGKEIGRTLFEGGDPPMGIVEGEFIPNSTYTLHRAAIANLLEEIQDHLNLTVVAPDDQRIDTRFVRIDDDGDAILCVTAMVNDADQWNTYFPDH